MALGPEKVPPWCHMFYMGLFSESIKIFLFETTRPHLEVHFWFFIKCVQIMVLWPHPRGHMFNIVLYSESKRLKPVYDRDDYI